MFKKVSSFVFVVAIGVGLSLGVQAATVGAPAGIDFPKGPGVITKDQFIEKGLRPVYFSGMTEFVFEKQLDGENASDLEIEGYWHLGKISLTCNENLQTFILLGVADLDLSGDYGTLRIVGDGDPNFAYGGGLSWRILEGISDYNITFVLSGRYRESDLDGGIDNPTPSMTDLDTKIEELEIGLTAYKDFTVWNVPLRSYVSIFFAESDVNFSFKTNDGATSYDLGEVDNNRNVGLALGCEKEPLKGMAINVEARFFTETALTLGATLKF